MNSRLLALRSFWVCTKKSYADFTSWSALSQLSRPPIRGTCPLLRLTVMINSLDHHEFDRSTSRVLHSKRIARHLLNHRPICQQVPLRLFLRWELGLQYAAPPSVPIGYLETNGLWPLVDLLFSGLDELLHSVVL